MSKRILETNRLILEKLKRSHFNDLYRLLSNANVHKYFPKVLDEKGSRNFFEMVQKKYREDGFCFWAVVRKEDDQFLGICGILKQVVNQHVEHEVGYRINDKYWGNGYGTEAAAGCIQYGKEVLRIKSIVSFIKEANGPSIKVAEKNGLTYEADIVFEGQPHRLYRMRF